MQLRLFHNEPAILPDLHIVERTAAGPVECFTLATVVAFVLPTMPRIWAEYYRAIADRLVIDHELVSSGAVWAIEYRESCWKRRRYILKYRGETFYEWGIQDARDIGPMQSMVARLLFAYAMPLERASVRFILRPAYTLNRAGLVLVDAPLLGKCRALPLCDKCGKSFDPGRYKARRFCSLACGRRWQNQQQQQRRLL